MDEHEEGKGCELCSWQEWETMVWVMTVFAAIVLGMFIVSGTVDKNATDTTPTTTTTSIHRR